MELIGQQHIAAPIDVTWVALNDSGILKDCIAGCESIERISDHEYAIAMSVRIGPVNAKFKGKLALDKLEPPRAYTINFEGQGGVAGFGKGSADVKLTPETGGTLLDYTARAQVGGKIAQIGSRLVDMAAQKMADDFFTAFNARVAASAAGGLGAAGTPGTSGASGASAAATIEKPSNAKVIPRWAWIAGAIAIAVIILWVAR
jgi:uncharacterized protein